MRRILSMAMLAGVALAASCADGPPTGMREIEVRRLGGTVAGTAFQCTGHWPSISTPCDGQQSAVAGRNAHRVPDHVALRGSLSSSRVLFEYNIMFSSEATAGEQSTGPDGTTETSAPLSGWINPIVTGINAGDRYAGTFSLTFDWGSISGAYDTEPPT
jgi:hypothetical protein